MSTLTILQQTTSSKKVALVEQQYPYGKSSVYMPTALVVVAAQLMAAGHEAHIVDLNIDPVVEGGPVKLFFEAVDVIGVAVIGAPYIPQTIELCRRFAVEYPNKPVIVGGQIISRLSQLQFSRLFAFTNAIQIASAEDLHPLFGQVPSPYEVSLVPVYEHLGMGRLCEYLKHEFPLWVSQGCAFNCKEYCTAERNQLEQHHHLEHFKDGIEYLILFAKKWALQDLGCYASSLDFFQNPDTVAQYLEVIAELRKKHDFNFRVRALSCLVTFLKAANTLPEFGKLLKDAGFWRVGFGVDGSGESEWKRQGKVQNHTADVRRSLDLCQKLGLQAEVIMITGYPTSSYKELAKTVYNSSGYLLRWRNIKLRAYFAKLVLPGNTGWQREWRTVEAVLDNPKLFYNLEFNSLGSPLTNPRRLNRWFGNLAFLILTLGVAIFGRSISFPLLPQGQGGLYGKLAKFWNRHMPIVD
ncbi:MAG: hypothetical protein P4L74_04265 [Candidatus Doudnabacteria bacterium]|nr:hypothetical protein [Candidatus Doudnabacteria bacterium]